MNGAEIAVLDAIQGLRCGFLDAVVPWVTSLGDKGLIWIALTAVLLVIPRTRRIGVAVAVSLILELLLCNVLLKPLIARPRPFDVAGFDGLLVAPPGDFSFPSGHTGASFACAAALFFSGSRLWVPTLALAVVMGFTRLYLYVHSPIDVLAGALLGVATGWVGTAAARRLARRGGE